MACRTQFRRPLPGEDSYSGATWLVNGYRFTHYNHTLLPNSHVLDCTSEPNMLYTAAVTARSWHPSGVHVAFADGHVRRIAETIDAKVWRAIATRQGGEILQSPN
jgi:prepilin-type processing-associated H-X9-DG protein